MKKISISLLCLLGIVCHSEGQNQLDNLPVAFPPGPTEASLGKYGDIPVGEYTGIPSINIPLHEVSVGSVKLPIALSYQSSGLKVEERSSWVGLGWSLNAGGIITRTVHNKADEGSQGYWQYGSLSAMELSFGNFGNVSTLSPVYLGQLDTEPDMFYFNFPGFSGKFVMEPSGNHAAHCIPFNNLKIEHSSTLSNFTITDASGVQYLFNVSAKTYIDAGEYTSTWYLSEIITPSGNITFTYSDDQHQDFFSNTLLSEVWYTRLNGNSFADKASQSSSSGEDVYSRVLTQIDASGETIHFYSTNQNRQDMPLSSILNSITVEDDKGILKKRFGFTHSYFGNPNINHPEDSRLKLDGITEYSVNSNDQKTYSLTYYTPQDIPATDSKAQDYWGYYNGINNSTLLLPADPKDFENLPEPLSGNRRPTVFDKTLLGTLNQITYPTGGTSTFIYEGNDYYNPHFEKIAHNARAQAVISNLANIPSQTTSFTISDQQRVAITLESNITGSTPAGDGIILILNRINADNSRTNLFTTYHTSSQSNGITNNYRTLNQGNYEIIASVDGTGQKGTITVAYWNLGTDTIKNSPCGGVRIKQIINTDPVTEKNTTTNFAYRSPGDPDASSGSLFSSPTLIVEKHGFLVRTSSSSAYLGSTQGSAVGYSVVTRFESSSPGISNGRTELYFDIVPYNFPSHSADVDTVLHFVDAFGNSTPISFHPIADGASLMTDNDVFRGNLARQKVYNADGILIKETINEYNLAEQLNPATAPNYFELETRKAYQFVWNDAQPGGADWSRQQLYFTVAKIPCPWIHIKKTTERVYDEIGSNPLENTTDFSYDNLDHCQLTKTETLNSKGETITTTKKYPQDNFTGLSATAEAARQDLISRHNISPVLETTILNNNTSINSIHTDYRIWPSGVNAPEYILSKKGQNSYENRIQFYDYDANENALELSKSQSVHEVYLWGYHHQYPVAKITGSTYAIAIALIDQSVLDNPENDQALRTELNKLRTATVLSKALISTYTYNSVQGITSETGPNGKTIYYEYDDFSRLKLIRDDDNNILKSFIYKYYNQ